MDEAMTADAIPTPPDQPDRAAPTGGRQSRPRVLPDDASSPTIARPILERAARVIRTLGHPLRLRLLERLEAGEVNVTDLVRASGATQALVSQHLGILRAEGVVGTRRDGGRIFYRITEPKVHRILDCIRDCDMPELASPWLAGDVLDLPGDD